MPSAFKIFILTFFATLYFYIAHALVRQTEWAFGEKIFILSATAAMAGFVIFMPLYLWSKRNRKLQNWEIRVAHAGHNSLAFLNFLLMLLVVRDLIGFGYDFLTTTKVLTSELDWLDFLYSRESSLLLIFLTLSIFLLGKIVVKLGPSLKQVQIKKGLFKKPLRIMQISDLHIGLSMSLDDIQRVIARANSVEVDLIVLTGDILDGDIEHHKREVLLLKKLRAPLGVFFVTGNHEYYWSVDFALEAMARLEIKTLLNEHWYLQHEDKRIWLAGVPDQAARYFSLPGADWEKVKPRNCDLSILLCHQPLATMEAKGFDIALSGHTHGGQFWPWSWVIRLFQRYHKGLFQVGKMWLYVNQGTGVWGPSVRLGTRGEITIIEIT